MRTIAAIGLFFTAFLAVVQCRPQDISGLENISTVEGISVGFRNGNVFCDSVVCPPKTEKCRVTRKNDPSDESNLKIVRKCFNSDGAATIRDEDNVMHGKFNSSISITYTPGENPALNSQFSLSNPVDED